jgi:predicted fused transcriptional regulator/phosphomethylpyrimidine kinase
MSNEGRIHETDIEWVCSECHRMNVSQSAWANVNYPYELVDFAYGSGYWCEDCNEEINIEEYKEKKHGSIQEVVNRSS